MYDSYNNTYAPVRQDQTFAPRMDLVSFPPSVQQHLAQAQLLLSQNQPSEAIRAFQRAGTELARTHPELFVLAVASQLGMRQITFEQSEVRSHTETYDSYAFGFRYGHREVTTTDCRTLQRSYRLS